MKFLFKLSFLFTAPLFFISCDDDVKDNHTTSTVQFTSSAQMISETDEAKTITISFDKPAGTEGSLQLQFNSSLAKYFETTPAALNGVITLAIHKNDSEVQFSLRPLNNLAHDGDQTITFEIGGTSAGLRAGTRKTLTLTIQDDESPDSYVSFIASNVETYENHAQAFQIRINVSESATANGTIVLAAVSENAVYGTHYTTQPAFVNNVLALPVAPGIGVVTFEVFAVNDDVISGDHAIRFHISETTGNIKKGENLEDHFRIKDDELKNMPKGYEVGAGSWGLRKTFEYNPDGTIAKAHWETNTPYLTTGTDTYYYNAEKQLTRINKRPGNDVHYFYENNRIVKEEEMDNDELERYTEYAYDDAGNLGGYQIFYLQPDGTYALSTIVVLLYYTDGNLYKKLVYTPSATAGEEPFLISTTTIESYREEENPFPVIEVLPNLNTQKKLPVQYRHEAGGQNLLYNFAYEFRQDGKVSKRTATGAAYETAVYNYY